MKLLVKGPTQTREKGNTYTALGHEGGLRAVLGHDDGAEESKGDGGELHFEGCLGVVWLVGSVESVGSEEAVDADDEKRKDRIRGG